MTSTIKVDTIQTTSGNTVISTDSDTVTIKDTSGTNTAMTINSDGVVTRNVIPSWRIGLSSDHSVTATGYDNTVFNKTSGGQLFIQGGCTLASGKVTVPVSGVYQVNTMLRIDAVGSGYVLAVISINDSTVTDDLTYAINGSPAGDYQEIGMSSIFKLDANDTVKIMTLTSADTSYSVKVISTFSGAMIG